MNDLISVVVPTYNRADDLLKAAESVIRQSYPYWELLIIDNHSTDNTREVIQNINDDRVKFYEIHNQGVIAASRNLGIHKANGKYVAFLDSDDVWVKNKLEKSALCLKQGYDVVYHDMKIVSDKILYFASRKFQTRQLTQPVYNDLLVNGNTLPTSSVVVEKDILLTVGGFKEDVELITGEDYDLWIRLSEKTQRFKRIGGTLGCLTKGDDNQFSSHRLISVLSKIEKMHVSKLNQDEQSHAHTNWLDYAYGRSYYNQHEYEIAKPHLLKVMVNSNNLTCRVKAFYMLFAIVARKIITLSR